MLWMIFKIVLVFTVMGSFACIITDYVKTYRNVVEETATEETEETDNAEEKEE